MRKEPLGPDGRRRLRYERGFLERLRGIEGIATLVEVPGHPESIVLEDAGEVSLAEVVKPLSVGYLNVLAVRLARTVAAMHRRGVIHRDITPANIVISRSGMPCLVDFALASSFAEIRPEFTHHTEIVGTLEYLAPEQTGRIGRPVDQRADLYALGATLYELATGTPPFGSGDPLRLTHDHLARVPVPPAEMNPAVTDPLSQIIMRLLEKEPDNRYQTAEGLVHDLERLLDAGPDSVATPRVGERDVPLRLLPPSRLVGRDEEAAALRAAFENARTGECHGVLLGGPPGVGKTALADELRAVVTGRDGWFLAGKFDQYRRDLEFDAVHQAFRAISRLLLAEPEDALAEIRDRLLRALGSNAGLQAAAMPEFATLLGVPPDPGDPLTAQVRIRRAGTAVLRAVASPERPVVLFVDDLQWAGRTPLGLVDLLLCDEPIDGLLFVGAYRDVEAGHPLAAPLSRWCDRPGVRCLRLGNLSPADMIGMVAEMLRVEPAKAAELAGMIAPYTCGNPYETVELLGALCHDGALTATAAGWRWDAAAVRAHLGRSGVAGLLAGRVEAMPSRARQVVEAMACLGGRTEPSVLRTAVGASARTVDQALAPALDDGILVVKPGAHPGVGFRHDRLREEILRGVDPPRRRALQLAMARRLAAVPELFAVAAEQYLAVAGTVEDPAERRQAVALLRRAAGQATLIGDHALVNALLTAALPLIGPDETTTLIEVRTGRHAALYSLGRLEEGDEEYRTIGTLRATAVQLADTTCVQVRSLTYRNRLAEATELGVRALRELGIAVPTGDMIDAEFDRRFGQMSQWLDHTAGTTGEMVWQDTMEPSLHAATRLINALMPGIYFVADEPLLGWLSLEVMRIWREHGPARTLLGPALHIAFPAIALRGDYAAAYQVGRRILALGESRGYEPDTSRARFLFAFLCCWFEPIENGIQAARSARVGLIAGGDLTYAGYTYYAAVPPLLDAASSLETCGAEVEAGLEFMRRSGNEQTAQWLDTYQWLVDTLREERPDAAREATPDEYAGNPTAFFHAHVNHAITAAIFGDLAALERHTATAMTLLRTVPSVYATAVAGTLRGMALAGRARDVPGDERAVLLDELEEVTRWLASRAADAPANYLHLLRLVEAERAWAHQDFRAAVLAFDAARREVARHQRPWHAALIAERAARFHLAHGVEHTGHELLREARRGYLAWGATAKVAQLDWAYPALRPYTAPVGDRPADDPGQRATVATGTLDLLGIVSTSQALSSETGVERLHARVVQVLSAMSGATGVRMPLWSEERHGWLLPVPGGSPVPIGGHDTGLPLSVLRYIQRTGEPLVVRDATRDDRFARDPYFAGLACCSLLAVPVLSRGSLRAVLVLENRLIRDAFTAERLDAVKLIAGQLAVSLDNVHLYAEFRRIADEQAALRRVATLVARGEGPGSVFTAVANEVGALIGTGDTAIVRFEPDGEATVMGGHTSSRSGSGTRGELDPRSAIASVRATGRAARRDAGDDDDEPGSAVAGPIVVEGRLWGAIGVTSRHERLPQDTEQRLADFTELVATAIANTASRNELTLSRARIVTLADQTRRRIEHDLHDGAQQRLVSLALRLRAAQAATPPEFSELTAELDELVVEATGALDDLRELAHGLHPSILARRGLGPALRALARRSPVPVDLDVRAGDRLPEHVEISGYYVVAEALANTAKHANASTVTVTVEAAGSVLRLTVRDDGAGGADFTRGSGLTGLRDRVEALGGRIVLDSPRGAGTRLDAELPLTTTSLPRP